jgi:energy-converting hydrogenase Eha subunit E
MTADDPLSKLAVADPHQVRMYTGTVVSVEEADGTCTVDPADGGDPVDGVVFYGNVPTVGVVVLMFLSNNMLATITP